MFAAPTILVVLSTLHGVAVAGSDNAGKIVGEWKIDGDARMFFEFSDKGDFRAYVAFGEQTIEVTKGRYCAQARDAVLLFDLDPTLDGKRRGREKITISGDTMTIAAGKDGQALTFTRLKQ